MADSIDLLRGVSLATSYTLIGGCVGSVVDAVVSAFTQSQSPAPYYQHREIRGVLQLIFSLASYGSVLELLGPANVDSPFALTCGAIMLFLSQPRMLMDLMHMFHKLSLAIYIPKKVEVAQMATTSPASPSNSSPINPDSPVGVANGVDEVAPGLTHPAKIPPSVKPAAVQASQPAPRVPFKLC